MGCSSSLPDLSNEYQKSCKPKSFRILDRFKSLSEVQKALRSAGLENCQLIVGIDCTKSNTWNGEKTFRGSSLHHIRNWILNPYEMAITTLGKTLSVFDDDGQIPVYGFGDSITQNRDVFSFKKDKGKNVSCNGFEDALECYRKVIPSLNLSGPTSFAPIINKAIQIVKKEGGYHVLIIIADGLIDDMEDTINAIVRASSYALSIITIGVGDGPWETMKEFDDNLPQRVFDNFQFVDFYSIMNNDKLENRESVFAMSALMEIPDQLKIIKNKKLIKYVTAPTIARVEGSEPGEVPPAYSN